MGTLATAIGLFGFSVGLGLVLARATLKLVLAALSRS